MGGYDPGATRRRLEAERANVQANLAASQLIVKRSGRPPTALYVEAMASHRARLDAIDAELEQYR
jgi:hypothetical protein